MEQFFNCNKKELRRRMLALRQELSEEDIREKSKQICGCLSRQDVFCESRDICLYMPVRNEVDVTLLFEAVWESGRKLWLPRVNGDNGQMRFYFYDRNTPLTTGKYHIPEPDSKRCLVPDKNTLIVMPGAVFSKKRERIGYGGGYYDRFLEENPMCRTAAVCYDFQILDSILTESHDKKPDIIISEKSVIFQ